jgi:hypothetical protein
MADKDADFDPYHKWLGIPRDQRPVTHYLLLGIASTEKDLDVIEDAAIRQTTHVRSYQLGPQAEACQRVLNEIASARQTLLNPDKRRQYDASLPRPAQPTPRAAVVETPTPTKPPIRLKPAKKAASSRSSSSRNNGLLLGLAVGGVAVAVLAVTALVVMSQSAPVVPKQTQATVEPIARVESKTVQPVEVRRPEPKIAEIDKASATKSEPVKAPIEKKTEKAPVRFVEKPVAEKGIDSLSVSMQQWTKQSPKYTKLIGRDEGLGIFGGVAGNFRGFSEHVSVQINASQNWVLEGGAGTNVNGYACTVTGIPPGWFDLEKTTFVRWRANGPKKMDPPKELCSESEGICWLSGIAADMSNGEGVHVALQDGKWQIAGVCPIYTASGTAAVCRFSKNADPTKLRRSEVTWRVKDGPLRLLDVKDGFCALSSIRGNIQSFGQQLMLHVKDDAWWLEGKDARGNLVVHAFRFSFTGNLPAIAGDRELIFGKSETKAVAE